MGTDVPMTAIGNTALLDEPLLGLVASRQCSGHVLLQTLELAAQWAREQQVVLSGFHSPLEQQVLRSMLRRHGRVIKVLARGLGEPAKDDRAALATGQMLIITACPPTVKRTTRATALARNRLVLALSDEQCLLVTQPSSVGVDGKRTADRMP